MPTTKNHPQLNPVHSPFKNTRDFYDAKTKLSQIELAYLWILMGGDSSKADLASSVSMAESSGIVHNGNACCKGIYALNTEQGVSNNRCAFKPSCATKYAIGLSNNGTDWTPWEAYTNGHYKQFLGKSGVGTPKAEAELAKIKGLDENLKSGLGDVVPGLPSFSIGDIVKFVARLFEPSFWLRVGKGIAGFLLLIFGALTLMKVLVGIEVPVGRPTQWLRGQIASAAGM